VRRSLIALCTGVVLVLSACTSDSPEATSAPDSPSGLTIEALSTRAEYVTGGDVLISVSATESGALDEITITADERDVTGDFAEVDGALQGLVAGLPEGESTITASWGDDEVELAVTNHPTTGPLFSGPHIEPFLCTTAAADLGDPVDEDCSAASTVDTREVEPGVKATVERGVLNRSIYTIAIPEPDWNGRLVYRFGGGCGTSYSQGSALVSAIEPSLLAAGFAVATSTLNTFQVACNDVLSAESLLMIKEHFIESYGLPEFTIGEGGSGGAIQQLLIAQNYPGLLDALAPAVPFPDALSISGSVTDCGLLTAYYGTASGSALREEQRAAVNGHLTSGTCALWTTSFVPLVDATTGCAAELGDVVYDPATNPTGVRCTLQDIAVNLVGRDPDTGFGNRALDNSGVQYGLQALIDGVISVDQFIDLNEQIGGYDIDGRIVAERTESTEEVMRTPYATGRVLSDRQALANVPILLLNIFTDDKGDIHDRQQIFAIRQRLATGSETDRNLVAWTRPGRGSLTETLLGAVGETTAVVELLDEWLTATAADSSDRPWSQRLAANRPAAAVDTCMTPDGEMLSGDDLYEGDNGCTAAYPVSADPRRVAGASLGTDIMKCALVPVDTEAYPVALSDGQLDRLRAVFPEGVCDWGRPGVGQVPLEGSWLRYG
jgi:hypothetical protein